MVMKKDKSSSEVDHSDDVDCGLSRAKHLVSYKSHFSASQSDDTACTNVAVACSSGSPENNMDFGTSKDASKDAEMLLESNSRERVIEDQPTSKLPPSSNESMACNKHSDVPGPNIIEEASIRATERGVVDYLPSCRELEKKKPCNSTAVNCNDQEKLEPITALDSQIAVDPLLDTEMMPVGSNSQASAKGHMGENGTDEKQSVNCVSSHDPDEKAHQFNPPEQLVEVDNPQVSPPESEGDEADLEEQDVKVCDICGDAGREDLLAICNRCSDGAEHTYCMREMLDLVPEGYWLCEECKSYEPTERQRQGQSEIFGGKERTKKNNDSLLEKKDPSLAGTSADTDSLSKRLPNKRRGSDMEVDPAAKRQVLESMVQSPTTSSPGRDGALSRDNSSKNIDKINAKLTHQTSISGRDNLEKPQLPNASLSIGAKGSFCKSNSFGTSSSKAKVKMVVEIPQKHKQSVDAKDASSKILGKSMTFKGSLSRSSATESKVKMLSPKDSHILESRGLKQMKDRSLFERKNSIKLDHSAANGCKNQLRGEVRRQHPSLPSGGGSSSTNGVSGSADAKSSLSNKEGCSSSLSRLDGVNSEKNLDRSSNHSRQCVGDGTLQNSASDTSSLRILKDGGNEENKLKAAIQAAMQKRLDMGKKIRGADKSNADSVGERATLDRPNSMNLRNSLYTDAVHEPEGASQSCSFSSVKETAVNTVNQSKVFAADSVVSFQARNMDLVSSDIEQMMRRSAIPEHEFAWTGSFEVYRGGSSSEQISGIQAHLSTCASYKVLEMVKRFPKKVSLSEVPRSCTWPVQFQDGGAEEDNIAVYFFAKDIESYERNYKNLLEKLMKDDLALKGNIDGIDLLIFPSKQLSKRSQRWNMLFFIWGVFRGRAVNCLDDKSGCTEKLDLSSLNRYNKAVTSDSGSPLEKLSIDGSVKENISTINSDEDVRDQHTFASGVKLGEGPPRISNGDHSLGEHSPHKTNSYAINQFGHHCESRNESESICYNPESSCETRYRSTVVEYGDPVSSKVIECQTSSSLSGGGDSSIKSEMISEDQSHPAQKTLVGVSSDDKTVTKVKDGRPQVKIKETENNEGCLRMKLEDNLSIKDTPMDAVTDESQKSKEKSREEEQCKEKENRRGKGILEEGADTGVSKHPKEACTGSFEGPTVSCQKRPLNDMNVALDGGDEETPKERVGGSIIFSDHDTSKHGMHAAKRYKVVSDKEMPPADETERFFFPVVSHPSESVQSRVASSGNNDHPTDGFPNLELALGVENRRAKSGFSLGLDDDDDRFQVNVGRRKEEEESSAALSLSLAFPFADKEGSVSGEFPEGK